METNDIKKTAVDLYWLVFILTGRIDIGIKIAADAASAEGDPNSYFAAWMRSWRRRLVIGRALTSVHKELAESARRTAAARVRSWEMPRNWCLSPDTTKADLESALLAIDLFPRATLILLVFEGVGRADASTLLDASPKLLKKAQAIGLAELSVKLAAAKPSAHARQSGSSSHAWGTAECLQWNPS